MVHLNFLGDPFLLTPSPKNSLNIQTENKKLVKVSRASDQLPVEPSLTNQND